MASDLDNINEILKECDADYITELIEFDSNGAIVGLSQYWYKYEEKYKLLRNDYKYTMPIDKLHNLIESSEHYDRSYKNFPYDFTGKDAIIYDSSIITGKEDDIHLDCITFYLSNSKYKDKFEPILEQFWQIISDTNGYYDSAFSISKKYYLEDLLHKALLTERSKIKFIMFREEDGYTDENVARMLEFFTGHKYENIYYTGELGLEVIKILFCDCPKITEILKEYTNMKNRTLFNTVVSDEFKKLFDYDYRTTFNKEFVIEYIKYLCEDMNIPYYGF